MAPKSILEDKNEHTPVTRAAKSDDERHRDVALHHATLIQQQKDVEEEIFQSMLKLIEMPSTKDADPASPTQTDIDLLSRHLRLFSTRDFDELIDERKANGQCGYVLCPRPHRVEPSTAKFRIITKANDMKIVPRESLEVWCSDECAERAMFLKVQITDEPAWLREPGGAPMKLDVMGAPSSNGTIKSLPLRLKSDSNADNTTSLSQGLADLRIERGDNSASARPDIAMSLNLKEREAVAPASAPVAGFAESSNAVEGHVPKGKSKDADQEEEDDQDWGV